MGDVFHFGNQYNIISWRLDTFYGCFVLSSALILYFLCVFVSQVVCKYIEDPVLFSREDVGMVKFDIRYMLMLRSVQPLRLYAYNVFWLRFANRWDYIHDGYTYINDAYPYKYSLIFLLLQCSCIATKVFFFPFFFKLHYFDELT